MKPILMALFVVFTAVAIGCGGQNDPATNPAPVRLPTPPIPESLQQQKPVVLTTKVVTGWAQGCKEPKCYITENPLSSQIELIAETPQQLVIPADLGMPSLPLGKYYIIFVLVKQNGNLSVGTVVSGNETQLADVRQAAFLLAPVEAEPATPGTRS